MKNPFRRRPNFEEDGYEDHGSYIQLPPPPPGRPPTPESLKDQPRRENAEAEIKAAYERAARAEVDAMMMARKLDVTLAQLAAAKAQLDAVPVKAITSLIECARLFGGDFGREQAMLVETWAKVQP